MTSQSRSTRILIVEDNSEDRDLLLRQLRKAGLDQQVQVIEDGDRKLSSLLDDGNDTIAMFLDLHLPGEGGLEILKRVREHERLQKLPVVIMTSSNHPDEIEACHRLGVVGYVKKPVTFSTFSKAIADTFHRPTNRESSRTRSE